MAGIPAKTDPLAAVRSLSEAAARQRGASFVDSGLRLFESSVDTDRVEQALTEAILSDEAAPISPFALGRAYELLLAPTARRKTGSHLTPETVARELVGFLPPPESSHDVLDPAVGGAAFLLAAADSLVEVDAKPTNVLDQLFGCDIDPGAVAVAEAALALWGLDHGVAPRPLGALRVGDGLLDELPSADRVVGNPPFLNQLRSTSSHSAERRAQLRERWGDLITAYTDDAWLFLAAGLEALQPDGALVMVQPISILAARHGDAVRQHMSRSASLAALWVGRDQVFDAAVQVCGLVVSRSSRSATEVKRAVGADFEPVAPLPAQPTPDEWGSAGAATLGVPTVRLSSTRTVGDLAAATAGFRDQFYGFVPFVSEGANDEQSHRLITVGMIDVLQLHWGTRAFKFAKQDYVRPVIDIDALRHEDERLAAWVDARLRPKLLMATQTRVAELWVDEHGRAIPATPVLSIEPTAADAESLWMLAAALSAPAISAHFLAANFGTAMSINALKIAARDVLSAPLPVDETAWAAAAALIREQPTELEQFGGLMQDAYHVDDPALQSWWVGRVPNRPKAP